MYDRKERKWIFSRKEEKTGAGDKEAKKALRKLRRRKVLWIAGAAVILLAILLAFFFLFPPLTEKPSSKKENSEDSIREETDSRGNVLVGEDTELEVTDTLEEFNESIRKLTEEYDDELVIAGERSTNRLILHFDGEELDLTTFLADRVIARENRMVVIQFASEEEARQCMESLKEMEHVSFVEMDEYNISSDTAGSSAGSLSQISSGFSYHTWGCEDMGMDLLADYLSTHALQQSAVVAVLDTGVLPVEGIRDRILSGTDVVMGGDGRNDLVGHGTHVSGTILDCTRGWM